MKKSLQVAILGGGPAGIFMFKRLIDTGLPGLEITIFERKDTLGCGMPYSNEGANDEHITNVSGNEIPVIVTPVVEWIQTVDNEVLTRFDVDGQEFNDYKVLPRLLFGQYLSAQFDLLTQQATSTGIKFIARKNTTVTDIIDNGDLIDVIIDDREVEKFDKVIVSTGHNWPKRHEGKVKGYYDSPYPPSKLVLKIDHPIAISGSSLTAVDAIRTLTRNNGIFEKDAAGHVRYHLDPESAGFKIVMHTRNGMLPAVRFHLENSHLENDAFLTPQEVEDHIKENNGFLSLDYLFEKDFKEVIRKKQPGFYTRIKDMGVEEFVNTMMGLRESVDPFNLLEAEFTEAEKSIRQKKSVYWKELLGALSFTMNYPAKHFSAEDMLRLQKVLSPLISVIIAYIPQSSTLQLLALHKAGVLELVTVGEDSQVIAEPQGGATYYYTDENNVKHADYFETYINCIGQPHLSINDFPFKSLVTHRRITPAQLKFRSDEEGARAKEKGNKNVKQDEAGNYLLNVPGVAIDDNFRVVDAEGENNANIFLMAVPYMGGFNPDYSGLDFCEEASSRIIDVLFNNNE